MKKMFGFTIAELLISLFIVMVIATAMVPVVGPKKLSSPNTKVTHGAFECFYDKDTGQLRAFRVDDANRNGGDTGSVVGNACEFRVPKANFYVVEMWGAGGDGAGTGDNTYYQFESEDDKSDEISPLDDFGYDIERAPAVVKNMFDTQEIGYWMYSAHGEAGQTIDRDSGEPIDPNSNYANNTGGGIHRTGGAGGDGAICVALENLDVTSKVETSALPTLKIERGGAVIFKGGIQPAGNGGNAEHSNGIWTDGAPSHQHATSYTEVGSFHASGNCYTIHKNGQDYTNPKCTSAHKDWYKSNTHTQISTSPYKFGYTYPRLDILLNYGEHGQAPIPIKDVFPDFNNETLVLVPARASVDEDGNATATELYSRDSSGTLKHLKSAQSGANGRHRSSESQDEAERAMTRFSISSSSDAIKADRTIDIGGKFPKQFHSPVLSLDKNLIDFSAVNMQSAMKDQMVGVPGSGAYPLILNQPADFKYTFYQIKRGEIPDASTKVTQNDRYWINKNETRECYTEAVDTPNEVLVNKINQPYCPAQQGHGGGIRISW